MNDRQRPDRGRRFAEEPEDITAGAGGPPENSDSRRRRPSRAAEPDSSSGPSRRALLIGTFVVVLVVVVAGIAAYFINSSQPTTPTTRPSSTWELALPVQVGNYTRDPNSASSPSAGSGRTTVSATYAKDGKDAVVILMTRPESDLKQFMKDAAMNAVTEQELSKGSGSAQCGTSSDNNYTGCVVLRDDTAVLVMGLLDQSRQDLADLAWTTGEEAAS